MKYRSCLALGLILLVGCQLKTRSELDAQDANHAEATQTPAQQREVVKDSTPVAPYKEKAPPSAYRFEEYDEQMRQLSGRVDSLENAIAQINSAKQSDKDSSQKDRAGFDQKFQAYEDALKKLETQIAALNDDVQKLKTAPPPPPVEVPAVAAKSANELGDEQFAAKKWKDAIVSYQKYRDANPKGRKFGDATLKIGMCFQELGMKDEARAFLEEVTNKFPGSKEAKKASARLKSLR